MSEGRRFPCPNCKGKYVLEPGERVDVGLGGATVQVSHDLTCHWCDYGFIQVGSDDHWNWRKEMLIRSIWNNAATEREYEEGKFMDDEELPKFVEEMAEKIITHFKGQAKEGDSNLNYDNAHDETGYEGDSNE